MHIPPSPNSRLCFEIQNAANTHGSSHGAAIANSTTTVTNTKTVSTTLTSLRSSILTTTVTNTKTVPTTLTLVESPTSTTSTALPKPTAPLGGFDAVEFGDESKWLFYTDRDGNIQHIQSPSYISWTPGYPAVITSRVRPG